MRRLIVLLVLTVLPFFLYGETNQPQRRLKIGLALEGGGALGLAHVGLLEWFQQNHIPIDYIAGASMGGLVAGFYASGMEPPEMRQLINTLDWNRLVNGEVDYEKLSIRRKQDVRTYGNSTFLGIRHGVLTLPSGLNSGQGLDLLLAQVALPYNQMKSFNDLPTPFRCVATDIVSADEKVFDQGSLASALRATMSIPGLFEPVRQGKSVYVDGGLLNNMPVDLVKAMGADIVIAVYLADDPFDPEKGQSAIRILGRTLSAVIAANEKHNIEMADLMVSIDLRGFSTTDFQAYQEIMSRGYEGAVKRAKVLSRFRIDDDAWAKYEAERAGRRKKSVPPPQFLEIDGVKGEVADQVRTYFEPVIGKPFDASVVEAQINRVMGTAAFSYMAYGLIEKDGKTGLRVYVHQSPTRPPTFQPALILDGSDYRNTRFAFAARLTMMNFGGFRSELRNDFVFGSTYSWHSEYFHPLKPRSNFFIAPQVFAETSPLDFYSRSVVLALYRSRSFGGGFDLGYQFSNIAELRVGYQASYQVISDRLIGSNILPVVKGRYGAMQASVTLDRVDDEVVPHSGILGRARFREIDANPGSIGPFPALEGGATYFHPVSSRGTVFAGIEGGSTLGHVNDGVPLYFLGGPGRLSAYGSNELYGNQYVYARAGYFHQITALSPLSDGRVYLLAAGETGRVWGNGFSARNPVDINAGVLLRTFFGPVFLGASVGDAGHRKWYFQMGRVF